MMPRPDLEEELAQTEGEPDRPSSALLPEEMPGEDGRVMRVEDAWRLKLVMGEKKVGRGYVPFVRPCSANVTTILQRHPQWAGVVAHDEFRAATCTLRAPPWNPEDAPSEIALGPWTSSDTDRLKQWLVRSSDNLDVQAREVARGLSVAADARRVHPVREYLRAIVWDGVPRLATVLSSYFGTADSLYEQGIGPRWLISAVARVMRPGCQVDCVLVVEGWQGAGKTSGFRALVPVPEWYADTGIVVGSKDSYGALHGIWIYGIDELDSARRVELTKLKSFITQTRDHYRPPYAERDEDFVRQNVFCGTTNEDQYLPDRTGNRRIWPARCLRPVDVVAIARDRDQLWAEAVRLFDAGHPWHVDTPGLHLLCEAQQAERQETDPWTDIIATWLESPTQVEMWGSEAHRVPLDVSAGLATVDVLLHCLGLRRAEVEPRHEMRVGAALRELGWRRVRTRRDGRREYLYTPPATEAAEDEVEVEP